MKKRPVMVMVLAASAASFAVTALAQPQSTDDPYWVQRDKFRKLDKDADGFVTKKETSHIRDYGQAFSQGDQNQDGKLTVEEFIQAEAINDRHVAGNYLSDAALTAKVKTALFREPELKSMAVSVETNEGRVQLSGWVESEAQRKKAMHVAQRVDGVKEVRDAMSIK